MTIPFCSILSGSILALYIYQYITKSDNMDIRKEDLPATLQAFDLQDNKEVFLAEQVVNNQTEIAIFTTRYVGKLIKAKQEHSSDTYAGNYRPEITKKQKS